MALKDFAKDDPFEPDWATLLRSAVLFVGSLVGVATLVLYFVGAIDSVAKYVYEPLTYIGGLIGSFLFVGIILAFTKRTLVQLIG